jgi:hypothetical protein
MSTDFGKLARVPLWSAVPSRPAQWQARRVDEDKGCVAVPDPF